MENYSNSYMVSSSASNDNTEYIIPIIKSEPIESKFNVNMNEFHGKNREDNQIIQSEPNKYNAFSEKHSKMWITQEHPSMLEKCEQNELAEIKKEQTAETCTTQEHISMFEEYQQKKLAEIKKEEITLTDYSFSYTTLPIKKEYNVAQDISVSTNDFLLGHPSTSQNEYSFSYATLPIKKEHNAAESLSALTNNFLLKHPPSTSQNDYFLKSRIYSMDYPSTSSKTLSIMKEHNEAESHLLNSINHFMLDRSLASRKDSSALLKPKNVFKFRSAIRKSGKSFCCKLCLKSKKFFQLAALRHHIKFQHFALQFQCFNCNFDTASPRSLRNHYKKHHNSNGPIKLAFTYLRSPMANRASKAKNKSQPHTKITKTNTEDFKKINDRYYCTLCPANTLTSYGSKKTAQQHIKRQHPHSRYYCSMCTNHYKSETYLELHYTKAHQLLDDIGSIKLEQDENFNSTKSLLSSKIQKHRNHYFCKICTKSEEYSYYYDVLRHLQMDHYGYRFACTECNMKYRHRGNLKKHYSEKHNKTASFMQLQLTSNCAEIKQNISKKEKLNYTELLSKIDNCIHCNLCGNESAKFLSRCGAQRHVKITHYGYRFSCSECDEQCMDAGNLRNHYKRAHNGKVGRIVCEIPKIKKQVEPKRLLNYAEGFKKIENKYHCTMCKGDEVRKYVSLAGIKTHLKLHHFGYRYLCSECDISYMDRKVLQMHYKRVHNIENATIVLEMPKAVNEKVDDSKDSSKISHDDKPSKGELTQLKSK